MKRILSILMAAALCLTALFGFAGCTSEKAPTATEPVAKTLRVGMTNYEPMNFKDANGQWTGFDTEFAQKAAESLGYTDVQFIEIDWDNKFPELESGAIDCIWNGMTITEEVKANADVTSAYVYNSQVVVMNASAKDSYSRDKLSTMKVAVEAGGAAADLLKDMNVTFTPVSAQTDALLEVASGSSEACVIDVTMANSMLGAGTSYEALTTVDSLSEEEYGIAFKKGSDLTTKMNEIITQFKTDGTFKTLGEKYNLTIAK